jgi:hypothetical protein
MVWEADPDEFQLALHPFGVPVEEFGGDAFRRFEDPAQRPCDSRCPVRAHELDNPYNWLALQ